MITLHVRRAIPIAQHSPIQSRRATDGRDARTMAHSSGAASPPLEAPSVLESLYAYVQKEAYDDPYAQGEERAGAARGQGAGLGRRA